MPNHHLAPTAPLPRNDWAMLAPPQPAGWTPTLPVTVVVTGSDRDQQALTLAALNHQTYPAELLDTVVLATDPAPVPASGRVFLRIPAGVVVAPDFVTDMVRWQHRNAGVVSLAVPGPATNTRVTAEAVTQACTSDTLAELLAGAGGPGGARGPSGPGALVELLAATDQLRTANQLAFLAVRGVPFAFRPDGGPVMVDPYLSGDTELGYRLAQAGAVFVPEPQARAWSVAAGERGPHRPEEIAAVAGRAGLIPLSRIKDYQPPRSALTPYLPAVRSGEAPGASTAGPARGAVPLVTAVVPVDGSAELVRGCVDALLGGDEPALHVELVGDWAGPERTADGEQEVAALRQLAADFREHPRVTLTATAPASGYPAPYLLRVPACLRVGGRTVRKLLAAAEYWQVGLVRVLPAGAGNPAHVLELWSSAALNRALRHGTPPTELATIVARTHGMHWEAGEEYGVSDVTQPEVPAAGPATKPAVKPPATERLRDMLETGGLAAVTRTALLVARKRIPGAQARR